MRPVLVGEHRAATESRPPRHRAATVSRPPPHEVDGRNYL